VSAAVPDGVKCVRLSAGVLDVDRLKQFGSLIVRVQLEFGACRVGEFRKSDAADRRIRVVGVDVERVDHQLEEPNHLLNVLLSYAAR